MNEQKKVNIRNLPTGVSGLDEILGGGIPEYSFNIIAGTPGAGKTTLAHQIMFANATPERPALFFTVMGEPAIKMLRYQQQYKFFDFNKLKSSIHFINLGQLVLEKNLNAVLEMIIKEVETIGPSIVVVDSFRTIARKKTKSPSEMELEEFIQRLALQLTSWQATTFLIGEYPKKEIRNNPVLTVADGLIWLSQQIERNSIVRKMQVIKLRGQASVPGLHTFRISEDGLQAFPRTFGLNTTDEKREYGRRLCTGVPELDKMLGGGIPVGNSVLVSGPSGAGKSMLGSYFIAEGLKKNEPGIIVIFEELPGPYINRAAGLGLDFEEAIQAGNLKILYLRPLDLSVDETVHEIVKTVGEIGAKRVVIDSLAGLEMALAPSFRTDFRESLYRMIAALSRLGVTILSTVEIQEDFTGLIFSTYAISFLSDVIIRFRYVCIDGELRRVVIVVKMRSSDHNHEIREYQITSKGIVIEKRIRGFSGLTSGIPVIEVNPELT